MSRARERSDGRTGGWRLADATSTYLRSAHEQKIDWYPWGPEAFETARRLNRPILLDVGAAWCHWCHVMDEGTYSDEEVARLLRQHFVAVKVDRDEHPEVDRRYQRQVSVLTGEGGWPLTAFLTPSGEVFLGGTYFPPLDGMGRPGLRRVLSEVARLWKEEPAKLDANRSAIREALGRMRASETAPAPNDSGLAEHVRARLYQSYDTVNGGFGHAPKFPHPSAVSFLLFDSFLTETPTSAARGIETLRRMADGGMYDQVGGGFHRYSVDEGWHIPHFEKMGVDNAALLSSYVEGYRWSGEPRLRETVRGTLDWMRDVLTAPDGGFFTSQDADNAPGDDGSYFTWSRPELKQILTAPELRLLTRFFGVGSDGRMPHDPERNVLFRLMPIAEAAEGTGLDAGAAEKTLAGAVAKLREARSRRPTPIVDQARYSSINGAFIRALSEASPVLGEPGVAQEAARAADRFLASAFAPDRGIAHRLGSSGADGFGLLDDQAEFARGLVELAGTRLERKYLEAAETLLNVIDREFRGEGGLLRDVAPNLYDGPIVGTLDQPSYPIEDSPHLSANAAAALAYLRFASLTNRPEWTEKARSLVGALGSRLGGAGLFAAGTALAAGLLATPAARVVVEGNGPLADRIELAARSAWHPNVWVFRGAPPEPFSLPEELTSAVNDRSEPRALICFGTRCLPPVTDPEAIEGRLRSGGRGHL